MSSVAWAVVRCSRAAECSIDGLGFWGLVGMVWMVWDDLWERGEGEKGNEIT